MKYRVNENCIGCGQCVSLTDSKVFDFNDDGLAHCILEDIPADLEDIAKEAIEECPTEAIEEVEK